MFVYLNNKLVPSAEAKVSVFDHGFLYGDGIYETMRVYEGVVFQVDEHLKRLRRSASLIGLDVPKSDDDIKASVYETLIANTLSDAYLRLTISRGYGEIGLDPDLCKEPTFIIIAQKFKSYPRSYYEEGISLKIASVRRNLIEALNPQIKSLNFLNNILAKIEARKAGANEAIMLNASGHLAEGTISNIFFLRDGVLNTPSIGCGILDGITRSLVIDLAAKNSILVKEGEFVPEDLLGASEVFITNSTMEVMPVSKVDEKTFKAGETAALLLAKYKKEVTGYVREKKEEAPSLWE
ncbi:MAG: aminodeoxychorismate lyase [Nitrospirae bacterium]|nr:aminodeoxychorismate lyase [Nitrospirota bacterium]